VHSVKEHEKKVSRGALAKETKVRGTRRNGNVRGRKRAGWEGERKFPAVLRSSGTLLSRKQRKQRTRDERGPAGKQKNKKRMKGGKGKVFTH